MRRAREVFARELARLGVSLPERPALDGLLNELATRARVSRPYFVRTFLTEETVVKLAWRAVTERTGQRPELHLARQAIKDRFPDAVEWPEPVRNLLVEHIALRGDAEDMAEALLGHRRIEEVGSPLQFRYEDDGLASWRATDSDDGSLTVVTVQSCELMNHPGPLQPDPAWGYPEFEWAYPLMEAAYRRQTGSSCRRVLWAWADPAVAMAAQRPDLCTSGAPDDLLALARPGSVIVVARVPVERCLLTSHVLWDAVVLRGRYLPVSFEDAVAFFHRYGTLTLPDDADDRLFDAISASWVTRFLSAGTHPMDFMLQACVDEIRTVEIVSVLEPDPLALPLGPLAAGETLRPRPLVSGPATE